MTCGLEDLGTAELIQRCLAGNEFAWWHLHQRYWPYLVRSVRHWLEERARDAALVQELAMNVWTSLWGPNGGRLGRYKPERSRFATLLHRLARNEVRRRLTPRKKEIQAGSLPDAGVVDPRKISWGENILLEEFARRLSDQQRRFLFQCLVEQGEGLKAEFSAANIRKLRQRVLEKWRAFMAERV